jgi:hypothetical protein
VHSPTHSLTHSLTQSTVWLSRPFQWNAGPRQHSRCLFRAPSGPMTTFLFFPDERRGIQCRVFTPVVSVTYVWACTELYYKVEHLVLIIALLITFLLFYYKFVLKKELTQTNLTNNRRIRRKDAWSATATDMKLNTAYDTSKSFLLISKIRSLFNI